jgi:hypothetical protein
MAGTVTRSHTTTLGQPAARDLIADWPRDSAEAAELVIDQYGEPHEATPTQLAWFAVGPWKRIIAQRTFWAHDFPAPHIDCVESFVDYRVPTALLTPLAEFDGSVMVERTSGEVSARCHDEQANFLALNLMHDMVLGTKDVAQARAYYAKEFLDARRKRPTPYMQGLRFQPPSDTADPDVRALSDEQIEEAKRQSGSGS